MVSFPSMDKTVKHIWRVARLLTTTALHDVSGTWLVHYVSKNLFTDAHGHCRGVHPTGKIMWHQNLLPASANVHLGTLMKPGMYWARRMYPEKWRMTQSFRMCHGVTPEREEKQQWLRLQTSLNEYEHMHTLETGPQLRVKNNLLWQLPDRILLEIYLVNVQHVAPDELWFLHSSMLLHRKEGKKIWKQLKSSGEIWETNNLCEVWIDGRQKIRNKRGALTIIGHIRLSHCRLLPLDFEKVMRKGRAFSQKTN